MDATPQPPQAPAAPQARRPRGELAAYALLVAVALALRLCDLGDRPFHHDESQDAYFSWIFFTDGDYEYNPLLHGPLRFYLTAAMYALFGDSDFTARLAPALMGTLMVPLPYLLRAPARPRRRVRGRGCCSPSGPSYLYFSRFAREDIYIASITLALLVVAFRFLDRPRRHHPALIGALLALSFATKETTFITVFVAGTFFVARAARRGGELLLRAGARRRPRGVGLGAGRVPRRLHAALHDLPHPPRRACDGLYTGLDYWLGQHDVGRGGESWIFYVVVLFGVEWPALLLGAVGAVVALRRPTLLRVFLIWAFVLSLRRLLVGGREVRLAGAAPAAAAAAAGRDRRAGDLGRAPALVRRGSALAAAVGGVRLRRLRLVPRQRRAPRRPARAAGLDAVLGGGRSASPTRSSRRPTRRARRPAVHDHRRLRRGRDVPVGVVLPRPRRRLRRPQRGRHRDAGLATC